MKVLKKTSSFFCIALFYIFSFLSTQSSHSTAAINRVFSEDTTADSLQQALIDSLEKKLYDHYTLEFDCKQLEEQLDILQAQLVETENNMYADSIASLSKIKSLPYDTNYVAVDTVRWMQIVHDFIQLPDFNAKKDSIHARQKDSLLTAALGLFIKKNQTKTDSLVMVTALDAYRNADKKRIQAKADLAKQQTVLLTLQNKKANCPSIAEPTVAENNEQVAQKLSGLLNKDSSLVFEKIYKKKKYLIFKYIVQAGQDSFDLVVTGNRTKGPQTIKIAWDKQAAKKDVQPIFIMNAGMFKEDYAAQGLLIEKTKDNFPINPLDTDTLNKGKSGNFYLHPNGVFYIKNDGRCYLSTTAAFIKEENHKKPSESSVIKYATQSGPMLVINKKIHKAFNPTSKNVNIRNGIGIRNIGKMQEVYMVISQDQVTFHEMASFYKDILQCENALYLDGVVSRMYVQIGKKQWGKLDNNMGLGPLFVVTKKKPTIVKANKK